MNVTSVLDAVTVYRQGALCTRRARIEAPEAPRSEVPASLRLVDLPLSLEPGSLRARVVSGPAGLVVRDVRAAFDVQSAAEVDLPVEEQALRAAREECDRLQFAVARLGEEIRDLELLRPRFVEPKRGDPPREAHVASMIALAGFSGDRLTQRLARRRQLQRQLDDAKQEVELRERRVSEASTAQRGERARLTRVAVVTLSQSVAGPLELALEYQVPGARWVPAYELRLEKATGGVASALTTAGALRMRAQVVQRTGEEWTGVKLALSTASLSRRADVPELKSLRIGRSQAEPPKAGFRDPPVGLDALFADYDAALSDRAARHQQVAVAKAKAPPSVPSGVRPGAHVDRAAVLDMLERSRMVLPEGRSLGGLDGGSGDEGDGEDQGEEQQEEEPTFGGGGAPASYGEQELARMAPPPAAFAAPRMMAMMAPPSPKRSSRRDEKPALLEESEAALPAEPPPPPERSLDAALLDYDRLLMGGVAGAVPGGPSGASARGRLHPGAAWEFEFSASISVEVRLLLGSVTEARRLASEVAALAPPPSSASVAALAGFDYRYDCAARVDVPATGQWTSLPVMACDVRLTPEFTCVPAVDPSVYRTLLVDNATPHALLAGPVDVSVGDQFLLTTQLPAIPPGGDTCRLGLGVEESIKVARRTQYRETTGGLLGGAAVLVHEIAIELNNRLATPALIEVRERVPVPRPGEKDIKVEEGEVRPSWEAIEQPLDGVLVAGARRWRVTVPAGGRTTLEAKFSIRMPGDRMIAGGNRRV